MSADHELYAEQDAAYVLGALSSAERRQFEQHLEECATCRAQVAELAPTVALLPRLGPEDVRALDAPEQGERAEAEVRAGIAQLDRARARRHRRAWWISSAAAAVLLIAVAVGVPIALSAMSAPAATFALEEVGDVPLTASVRLDDATWGTRIDLDCRYPSQPAAAQSSWVYALAVVDASGDATTVSTWRADPGVDARLTATTATPIGDIRAIEIRSQDGTILMRGAPPGRDG